MIPPSLDSIWSERLALGPYEGEDDQMIYTIAFVSILALMYGSAALGYHWASSQHRDWIEAGWDHLSAIAEIRALTVKDYTDTFGERARDQTLNTNER